MDENHLMENPQIIKSLFCKMFMVKKKKRAVGHWQCSKPPLTWTFQLEIALRSSVWIYNSTRRRLSGSHKRTRPLRQIIKWIWAFSDRQTWTPSRQKKKKKCSFGNINNLSKILINKLCLQVKPWCDNLSAFEPGQRTFKKKTVVTQRRRRCQRLALAVFAASSDGCLRWSPAETDIWSWATWQRGSRYRGWGGCGAGATQTSDLRCVHRNITWAERS